MTIQKKQEVYSHPTPRSRANYPWSMNQLIDERATIKADMDQINQAKKELQQELDYLDSLLIAKMDKEEINRTANKNASVSINEATVPEVEDWDAFYKHILDTKEFALLQKRVSSVAYKEILSAGEDVPGLAPRTVRRINFKKL